MRLSSRRSAQRRLRRDRPGAGGCAIGRRWERPADTGGHRTAAPSGGKAARAGRRGCPPHPRLAARRRRGDGCAAQDCARGDPRRGRRSPGPESTTPDVHSLDRLRDTDPARGEIGARSRSPWRSAGHAPPALPGGVSLQHRPIRGRVAVALVKGPCSWRSRSRSQASLRRCR